MQCIKTKKKWEGKQEVAGHVVPTIGKQEVAGHVVPTARKQEVTVCLVQHGLGRGGMVPAPKTGPAGFSG